MFSYVSYLFTDSPKKDYKYHKDENCAFSSLSSLQSNYHSAEFMHRGKQYFYQISLK